MPAGCGVEPSLYASRQSLAGAGGALDAAGRQAKEVRNLVPGVPVPTPPQVQRMAEQERDVASKALYTPQRYPEMMFQGKLYP